MLAIDAALHKGAQLTALLFAMVALEIVNISWSAQ